jgi:hypothetical protein
VDAGGKGFVEVADAVGCEEEDAGVVFEDAEEDCFYVVLVVLWVYSVEGKEMYRRRVRCG